MRHGLKRTRGDLDIRGVRQQLIAIHDIYRFSFHLLKCITKR